MLLGLLGASGFLLDGPGAAALVSELVGNAVVAAPPPAFPWMRRFRTMIALDDRLAALQAPAASGRAICAATP